MFYDLLLCGSHGGEPCAVGAGLRGGVVGGLWLIGRIARALGAQRFFKVFSRRLKDGDVRTAGWQRRGRRHQDRGTTAEGGEGRTAGRS